MVSLAEQNSWFPQVGDMIVVYPRYLEPHENGYVGTIFKRGRARGSDRVFVMWSNPDHIPTCLLYTSPSPRDVEESRMPSSA